MNDKEFTVRDNEIWCNNRIYCVAKGKHSAEVIADRLNKLYDEIMTLKASNIEYEDALANMEDEFKKLKKQLNNEHTILDNAILQERTRMGKNSLKQYKEAIK